MTSIHHAARWLLILVVLLMSTRAIAQAAPGGIDLGRDRLVHQFDFEEADEGNFEEMPRYWYIMGRSDQTADPNFARRPLHRQMIERDGFPRFTRVKFSQPQAQAGDHSLHLMLNGGSAGAFLEVGAVAAVPNSDYAITARVKTGDLRHARARLIAYFVDSDGRRIDASAVATPLLSTKDQWQSVSIKLLGDHPEAAWISMQVELLQVQHQTALTANQATVAIAAGKHTVQYQDNKGDAWFDDISIWQVPRIVVRTQSAVNLIVAPQKPLLTFEVRDLSGRRLDAHVGIYDFHGKRIVEVNRTVGGGDASTWRWIPPLPSLGWYLVDMTLRDPLAKPASPAGTVATAEPVARTLRAFLWMAEPEKITSQDKKHFTLDLHHISLDELKLVPQVTQATGLRNVILSAWDPDVSIATQETRMSELDAAFQPLWRQSVAVSMSLSPLPRELAERLDLDPLEPLWLFARPPSEWMPWISPLIVRHGQNVRRWHLGADLGGELDAPNLAAVTRSAVEAVKDLAPDPHIALPWAMNVARRAELNHRELTFTIDLPYSMPPALLRTHLQEWNESPSQAVALKLQIAPATEMSQRRRVDDLAMRVLHAWEANVDGVVLARPWDFTHDRLNALHPDPLLSVFAALAQQLNGRRVFGRLPLGSHGQAMIFNGPRGPMLAAWLDGGPDDRAEAKLYLGENPMLRDVWGNATKLELVQGKHELPLTSTPVFIEGIDAELALFRTSFTVTPKQIESSQVTHEHTITLRNPWPKLLQGELTIVEPGRNWNIEPRRISVAIEPGISATFPIKLSFPPAEVAGEKRLVAHFEFTSSKRRSVDLETAMELGLRGIEIDTGLSVQKNATTGELDATATAYVTNNGNEPRTLYVFAICAGQPRQERIVTLKPGQSLMRRFRFTNVTQETLDAPLRIGVRDTTGPALMNHLLRFDGRTP